MGRSRAQAKSPNNLSTSVTVIICKNCNCENDDEYKYCMGCGSVLARPQEDAFAASAPEMIACPRCGTPVPSNFKFCGACGGAISAAAPAAAPGSDFGGFGSEPVGPPQPSAGAAERLAGRLIVIRPDGTEGAEIALPNATHTVGRDSDRKALANDPFLSPEHATFEPTTDGFSVYDADSLNGVFVRITHEVELEHGDLIRMGQELLRFEVMAQVEPVLAQTEPGIQLAGSPGEPYWGRLCLIAGPDQMSQAFPIGADGVTIGREIGDIVFNDDGFVSGRHGRISLKNGKPILEDLGSSNGTFRRIRTRTQLANGDLLLMGQQLFRLVVV